MRHRALQVAVILIPLLGLAARLFVKPPPVPTEGFLIHVYGPWQSPPPDPDIRDPSRTAPATILQFTADGRYVEHSCYVIDSGTGDLSISPGDGHVVAVGAWTQQGATLTVIRRRIYRFVPYVGPGPDPLCRPSSVDYELVGRDGVRQGQTVFKAVRQRGFAEWESYVSDAERSKVSCNERGKDEPDSD